MSLSSQVGSISAFKAANVESTDTFPTRVKVGGERLSQLSVKSTVDCAELVDNFLDFGDEVNLIACFGDVSLLSSLLSKVSC